MGSSTETPPILILGAGCAGLAAALRLARSGHPVLVIEQADHVGGLAGGIHVGPNIYEYGPHAFHTTDPEILADIKDLMGDELIEYHRTIKIRFLGKYFEFPLTARDVLMRLPPQTVARAAISFVWHFGRGLFVKPDVETSETLLTRYYGRVLYEIFFKSYIVKVWGISPAQFSPSFARERIPRLNVLKFADRIWSAFMARFRKRVSTEGYVEKVEGKLYTTRRGFSLITQRMADRLATLGARMELDTRVTGLERDGDRIAAVRVTDSDGATRRIECRAVINTLPINTAIGLIAPPLPPAVRDAAQQLHFRALVFVGVRVRLPKAMLSSFMYFREHSFNRVADLSQFGFDIEPKDCTLLVAEISCDTTDRYWTDDAYAKQAVLDDLAREDIAAPADVLDMHVFRAEHAYPIYTLHYERHRDVVLEAIGRTANMETAGRQGRFAYINTHIAIKMGYEAADRLTAKLQRTPQGAPESAGIRSGRA